MPRKLGRLAGDAGADGPQDPGGLGPLHGYGIARRIEQTSGDRLSVNYGTLYPALAQARAGGLHRLRVGRLGQQPEGQVLQAHASRAASRSSSRRASGSGRPRSSPASSRRRGIAREGRARASSLGSPDSFGRDRQERDLSEELEAHIQMHVDDAVRAGHDAGGGAARGGPEARRTRRHEGGRAGSAPAAVLREGLAGPALRGRSLGKNPGFAAVAIATLALGIGANTAIFTVVHAVLIGGCPSRSRPVSSRSGRRTRSVPAARTSSPRSTTAGGRSGERCSRRWPVFYDSRVNLTGDGRPEQLVAQFVMPSFFSTLGIAPMLGRAFAADEGPDGNDQVVILSHGLWQRRFGGDPAVVGRTIQVDRRPVTIVGVMPPRFGLFLKTGTLAGKPADLWAPMVFTEKGAQKSGRYASAIAQAEARRDARRRRRRKWRRSPRPSPTQFPDRDKGWSVQVVPLHDRDRGRDALDAPDPFRRRGLRAPHRLRERGGPAPRAGHRPRAGDGHPHGARRGPRADPLPAADGEPAPAPSWEAPWVSCWRDGASRFSSR